MLILILFECICLLMTLTMGKPVPGQNGGIIPPDTDLFSVSLLVTIAALTVLGVAVAVGVVHRSALASENVGSDDDFEDPANVATTIADHENQIN